MSDNFNNESIIAGIHSTMNSTMSKWFLNEPERFGSGTSVFRVAKTVTGHIKSSAAVIVVKLLVQVYFVRRSTPLNGSVCVFVCRLSPWLAFSANHMIIKWNAKNDKTTIRVVTMSQSTMQFCAKASSPPSNRLRFFHHSFACIKTPSIARARMYSLGYIQPIEMCTVKVWYSH